MLRHLKIKNFTLIDSLDIEFPDGFITITGQTGAGKSIILSALSLLTGTRADSKSLRDPDNKAIIEALFAVPSPAIKNIFENNSLDWDDNEIIIRREIAPSGRSRAFVNDSPVSLNILSEITQSLIDIHSQHNNLLLSNQNHQRLIIDAYADIIDEVDNYHALFRQFSNLHAQLSKLKKSIEDNKRDKANIEFQLDQLKKLNLKKGELESLEREFDFLSEAENAREMLSSAYLALEGREINALALIKSALDNLIKSNIEIIEKSDSEQSIINRLSNILIELKDISQYIRNLSDKTQSSPEELSRMENRISDIYKICKHFSTANADSLISIQDNLEKKLLSIQENNPELEILTAKIKTVADKLRTDADIISNKRKKAATLFSNTLIEMARPLGLKNINFNVDFKKGKIGADGQDIIEFQCAFNKNQSLSPMAAVASGGEISRLMLCIKAMVANRLELPTIIFDEVDTGVSGEIADSMGALMLSLGKNMQIITITHLPQVAAKGEKQFVVSKQDNDTSTVTQMHLLSDEERVIEIARLLSGANLNDAALNNARTLLHPSSSN